uniref:Uncharacterized protein n=1 Tax=Fagus sylvatica TaxID=28930 RepID=A0A2N9ETR8_FAGSY
MVLIHEEGEEAYTSSKNGPKLKEEKGRKLKNHYKEAANVKSFMKKIFKNGPKFKEEKGRKLKNHDEEEVGMAMGRVWGGDPIPRPVIPTPSLPRPVLGGTFFPLSPPHRGPKLKDDEEEGKEEEANVKSIMKKILKNKPDLEKPRSENPDLENPYPDKLDPKKPKRGILLRMLLFVGLTKKPDLEKPKRGILLKMLLFVGLTILRAFLGAFRRGALLSFEGAQQ